MEELNRLRSSGTMLLWFGWFGFNGASALIAQRNAILALVNTNVAPSVTLLTWVLLDLIFKGRPTVTGMCVGVIAGLVGITPAAGFVRVWAGAIIGVGSAIFPYIFTVIRDKYKLFDDRLDVFGCHGIAALWGGFSVGLFLCDVQLDNTCNPSAIGAVYGNGMQLVYQCFGILTTSGYCFFVSLIIMYVLKKVMKITVDRHVEERGLDQAEFKEHAMDIFKKRKTVLMIKKATTQIRHLRPSDHEPLIATMEKLPELVTVPEEKNEFPNENNVDVIDLSLGGTQRKKTTKDVN